MKPSQPPEVLIVSTDDPNLGDKLRDAMGIPAGTPITIITPQFERSPGSPPAKPAPTSFGEWIALATMSKEQLIERGLRLWSDDPEPLLLFSYEWFDAIPEGLVVTSILNHEFVFERATAEDDQRFGYLSYGIRSAQ